MTHREKPGASRLSALRRQNLTPAQALPPVETRTNTTCPGEHLPVMLDTLANAEVAVQNQYGGEYREAQKNVHEDDCCS